MKVTRLGKTEGRFVESRRFEGILVYFEERLVSIICQTQPGNKKQAQQPLKESHAAGAGLNQTIVAQLLPGQESFRTAGMHVVKLQFSFLTLSVWQTAQTRPLQDY